MTARMIKCELLMPSNLPPALKNRWQEEIAGLRRFPKPVEVQELGMLVLCRYELEAVAPNILTALRNGDAAEAQRWTAVQTALQKTVDGLERKLRYLFV